MTLITSSKIEKHVRKMMSDHVTYYRVKNSRDGLAFEQDGNQVFVYYDETTHRFRCYYCPIDKWGDKDQSKRVDVF